MGKPQISERSEKDKKLGHARYAVPGKGARAWADTERGPTDFDDSAESWRGEVERAWTAEGPAAQAWLVVGAVACAGLTVGWVGWVVWLVVGKGW